MERADKICKNNPQIVKETQIVECYRNYERQAYLAYYPGIMGEFDSYYDAVHAAAVHFDSGKINKTQYEAKQREAANIIVYATQNYTTVMAAKEQAHLEARKKQYCASIGAAEGSSNYYDCRKWVESQLASEQMHNETLAQQRALHEQQLQQASEQKEMERLNSFGSWNRSVRCTSRSMGNTVTTECD